MSASNRRWSVGFSPPPSLLGFASGLSLLVLVSLGVVPLIQWWGFDHANGPIAFLFANPAAPWVWIWPLLIGVAAVAVLLLCDALAGPGDADSAT